MSHQKTQEIEHLQSVLRTRIDRASPTNHCDVAEMCKAYAFLEEVRLKNIEQEQRINSTPRIIPRQAPPTPSTLS